MASGRVCACANRTAMQSRNAEVFVRTAKVSTKDGHLICRHGPTLDDSTDVLQHPEFAARRRSQVLEDLAADALMVCRVALCFTGSWQRWQSYCCAHSFGWSASRRVT